MRKYNAFWVLGILTAALLLVAVACGDDATATPAPTSPPPAASIDTQELQDIISAAVKASIPEVEAGPSAQEIRRMVQTAVEAAFPEGASPQEIQSLVETAVSAASGEALTSEEVAALVASAVADAISDQPEPLTAEEIEAIVKAAIPATPTPAPTPTPQPTATPVPVPTQAPKAPAVSRLKVATNIQRETNDPADSAEAVIQMLPMYEALLRQNENAGLDNMLAESWSASPDLRTWTFNLKRGVQFHKGWGEFTAKDVVHTSTRQSREGIISIHQSFYANDVVGNMDTPDPYTITFNLPNTLLDMDLVQSTRWFNLILSKDHFDAEGEDGVLNNPIGTNAYQHVERAVGEYVLYERVPFQHHRVTPDFQELQILFVSEAATRMAMVLTNGAHMTVLTPDLELTAVEQGMRLIKANVPSLNVTIWLNGQYRQEILGEGSGNLRKGNFPDLPYSDVYHPVEELPWADIRVREALNRAIDRQAINTALLGGLAELEYVSQFHSILPGWNTAWVDQFEENYGYDPVRARALLDEVEAEIGQPLAWENTVIVLVNKPELAALPDIGEVVANQWAAIGANLTIEQHEWGEWAPHIFSVDMGGVAFPNACCLLSDPLMVKFFYYSKNAICCHHYENDQIDVWYEELEASSDLSRRDELLRLMGDHFYDNYVSAPLFWLATTFVVNPRVVEEYSTNGILGLRDLEHVEAMIR